MSETRIVKAVQARLRARGANVLKLHGSPYQPAGLDLLGCAPALSGRMFVLEVKQPGENATPRQSVLLEQWRRSGAIVGVVRSADEAEAEGDVVYCAGHRVMADDGTLWLRCVFCGAPVAPNDPIACSEDRVRLDASEEGSVVP